MPSVLLFTMQSEPKVFVLAFIRFRFTLSLSVCCLLSFALLCFGIFRLFSILRFFSNLQRKRGGAFLKFLNNLFRFRKEQKKLIRVIFLGMYSKTSFYGYLSPFGVQFFDDGEKFLYFLCVLVFISFRRTPLLYGQKFRDHRRPP